MSYQLKKSAAGKYMFNLLAGNHQVILTSQEYESKQSALGGIESVRNHGSDEENFELKTSSAGQPFFVLIASNGQTIGTSQMYSAPSAASSGIASVISNSPSPETTEA